MRIVALAAIGFLSACQPSEADLVSACADVMRERMANPSTFQVVEATSVVHEPYSVEWETANFVVPEGKYRDQTIKVHDRLREIAEGHVEDGYQVAKVVIEYQATDRYGTTGRDEMICEMRTPAGGLEAMDGISDFAKSEIRINGLTASDYRLARLGS